MVYGEICDICSDAVLSTDYNGQSAAKLLLTKYNYFDIIIGEGSTTISL